MPKTSTSGQGRKKGVPNKINADLRAMILGALDKAGGLDYLAERAVDTPAAFMALVGKVLPLTIQGAGPGGAILVSGVRRNEDDAGYEFVPIAGNVRTINENGDATED